MLPGINGYFAEILEGCRLRRSRPPGQYVKVALLRHWNAHLAHKTILFLITGSPLMTSILGEGRAGVVDPLLNAGPEPLMVGIVDEPLRNAIAVRHQTLQHHGEITSAIDHWPNRFSVRPWSS